MSNERKEVPKFKQLAGCGPFQLFALDENGEVWQHRPSNDGNPALSSWGKVCKEVTVC